eukprot:scaffold67819_cov23-Tisochrysis_lutea.AAC.2
MYGQQIPGNICGSAAVHDQNANRLRRTHNPTYRRMSRPCFCILQAGIGNRLWPPPVLRYAWCSGSSSYPLSFEGLPCASLWPDP